VGSHEASLHPFYPCADGVTFFLPSSLCDDMEHILASPMSYEAPKGMEIEVTFGDEGVPTRFAPHDECMFRKVHPPRPDVVQEGMDEYDRVKRRIMYNVLGLGMIGTGIAAHTGGEEMAMAYALGGSTGLLYQYLLQYELDRMGTKQNAFINPATRLMLLALVLGGSASWASFDLLPMFLGFWMNKAALWLAFAV
jgi:ATP synthase protein I